MSEEWGPWIEHDGKWKPSDGVFVEKEYADGTILVGRTGGRPHTNSEIGVPRYNGETFSSSWIWGNFGYCVPIIRYRIRKPRGLTILEGLLENMPEQVDA